MQIYTDQEFMTKLIAALAGGTGPDFTRFKEYQALDMAALGNAVELDGRVAKDKRKWRPEVATIPVRKTVYDKPPYSNDPGWKQIIDALCMPGNRPEPRVPQWDNFTETTICPSLLDAWAQKKSPKDALAEATRLGNDWLAKNLPK